MEYPNNLSEKQKYFHLLGEVCDQLKPTHIDNLIRNNYPSTTMGLNNTRTGKKTDIRELVDLVQAGLPDHVIAPQLLPAKSELPLFAEQLQQKLQQAQTYKKQ